MEMQRIKRGWTTHVIRHTLGNILVINCSLIVDHPIIILYIYITSTKL